jgi:hypothetical protein
LWLAVVVAAELPPQVVEVEVEVVLVDFKQVLVP